MPRRTVRLTSATDERIESAAKLGGYSSPSAFLRAAINKELGQGREGLGPSRTPSLPSNWRKTAIRSQPLLSRTLPPGVKQLPRSNAERRCDPDKIPKGWIASRRFNTAEIRSVNACFLCQTFL